MADPIIYIINPNPSFPSLRPRHPIRHLLIININLAHQNRTPDHHRKRNQLKIHHSKLPRADDNLLSSQNIPPQQPRERRAKGCTEGAVVEAQRHAVDGGPEGALRDGGDVRVGGGGGVDEDPFLDNAAEEDCGADVGAGELGV